MNNGFGLASVCCIHCVYSVYLCVRVRVDAPKAVKLVEKLKKPSSAHAHLLGKMFPSSSSSTAIALHAKRSATFDPTEDGLSDFSKQNLEASQAMLQ